MTSRGVTMLNDSRRELSPGSEGEASGVGIEAGEGISSRGAVGAREQTRKRRKVDTRKLSETHATTIIMPPKSLIQ